MEEREQHRISRREFGRIGIGAAAAVLGVVGAVDANNVENLGTLNPQHKYQQFVTDEAIRCANECGDAAIPQALGFDTTSPYRYRLVVPGITKEVHSNPHDGWDTIFVPMITAEGLPPPPKKAERPHWSREELLTPMFKGPSTKPLVALTIDDGYYNREEVLQTIIDKDVSATFLIIGSLMEAYPEFIKKAEKSGRITWANHSYDHHPVNGKSASYVQDQLNRTESALKRIADATTIPLWRPPGGGINSSTNEAAADLGYRSMLWNDSGDAGTQWTSYDPRALANYYMGLLDRMTNPWGSILLLHFRESTAVSKVPGVGSALSLIIDGVRARGMEPVSADKLLMVV